MGDGTFERVKPPDLHRIRGSACLLAAIVLGGCQSDHPWVETDPDAFVARDPGAPWTTEDARRDDGSPAKTPSTSQERGRSPLARMEDRMRPLPAGPTAPVDSSHPIGVMPCSAKTCCALCRPVRRRA